MPRQDWVIAMRRSTARKGQVRRTTVLIAGVLATVALVLPMAACSTGQTAGTEVGTSPAAVQIVEAPVTVELPEPTEAQYLTDQALVLALQQYIYARLLTEQLTTIDIQIGDDLDPVRELYEEAELAWARAEYAAEAASFIAQQAEEAAEGASEPDGQSAPQDLGDGAFEVGQASWQSARAPSYESVGVPASPGSSASLGSSASFGVPSSLAGPVASHKPNTGPGATFAAVTAADPRAWAEEMAAPYDEAAGARNAQDLAQLMADDAKAVAEKAQYMEEVLAQRAKADAAFFDKWGGVIQGVRSAAKIILTGIGIVGTAGSIPAMGAGAAAIASIGICLAGADAFLELWKGGASIFLGLDNSVTAAVGEAQDRLSPYGFAVGFPSSMDVPGMIVNLGNMASDYLGDGTIIGYDISSRSAGFLTDGDVHVEGSPGAVTMVPIPVGATEAESNRNILEAGFNPKASASHDVKAAIDRAMNDYGPDWEAAEARIDALISAAGGSSPQSTPAGEVESDSGIAGRYLLSYSTPIGETGTSTTTVHLDGTQMSIIGDDASARFAVIEGTYDSGSALFVGYLPGDENPVKLTFNASAQPVTASGRYGPATFDAGGFWEEEHVYTVVTLTKQD